ncbi:MAG: peptide deformylase [Ruminococcus sp.]|nr:peptide deformylase [Ruminococcus sp.]
MIKQIVKDTQFLGIKSEKATNKDRAVITDLKDTLRANRERCVGMAANMIGVSKRIIIFTEESGNTVMINPQIIKKQLPFETEEGCLSLTGERRTTRYMNITVEFLDESFRKQKRSYSGFTAQIIQHECDHLDGIII